MEERTIRIVAVGDERLAGVGDPRALGWYGRVLARTSDEEVRVESFSLPAPGESVEALSLRWFEEAMRRFGQNTDNRLVVALNDRDVDLSQSTARSRLNLANILDSASQNGIRVFVVGPAPSVDDERNRVLSELNAAYADVTTRRSHAYVDAFNPLVDHENYRRDLAANGGQPGQTAYGLIAWLVLHRGWYQWLGLPQAD
ncbi:GDSL-type esterase/lipase family protein [Falsarthrobacter nasiphocae]|uniref:SGNH hydrolase-type esterase domain-containing protein n=1 Tax=Falsarthrobacter nasiphocae TaxID=189863 RepID=A0AAE3YJ98_9MICC|nr:GDSL-type esterase/lipase family protein [Falsarthrobacter nasiphocae]MDR6892741.1 hypothetical protein [Falsarthrobacter nasiphocae]